MSQIDLERDVDLSQLSTLKVGGKARRLLRVKKVGDLVAAAQKNYLKGAEKLKGGGKKKII